jgi:hypothetical protein
MGRAKIPVGIGASEARESDHVRYRNLPVLADADAVTISEIATAGAGSRHTA